MEYIVQDERPNGAPSLNNFPRMTSYEQLSTWVNIIPKHDFGWTIAPAGALVWKLVGFYIQDGPAAFIGRFYDLEGSAQEDVAVVHSWNGAPALPNPDSIVPDYNNKTGVSGFTNDKGEASFPYSGNMVYTGTKPYQGLGMMWPLCPQHLPEPKYADAAFGLGWIGGTEHTTINPIFQLTRKAVTPASNFSLALFKDGVDLGVRIVFRSDPSGSGYELVLMDDQNQKIGVVPFVPPFELGVRM